MLNTALAVLCFIFDDMDMPTLVRCLVGPLLGALIGYVTNYIAVRMLFWPYKEKRIGRLRLPFTPGIIPKRQPAIAAAVGAAVSRNLFTGEDLKELLLEEKTEARLVERVTAWVETSPDMEEPRRTMEELALSVVSPEQYEALRADLTSLIADRLVAGAEKLDIEKIIMEEGSRFISERKLLMRFILGKQIALKEEQQQKLLEGIGMSIRIAIREKGREKLRPVIRQQIDEFLAHPPTRPEGLGDEDALRNTIRTIYRMIVGGVGDHFSEMLDIASVVENKILSMEPRELEALVLSVMRRELRAIVSLGALLGFLLGLLTLFTTL